MATNIWHVYWDNLLYSTNVILCQNVQNKIPDLIGTNLHKCHLDHA